MLEKIMTLKEERLPLVVGGVSWLGLTGMLFEMAHLAWLLALSLSFFPSLFVLFAARTLMEKPIKLDSPSPKFEALEDFKTPTQVEVLNPNLERFLTDFSQILEMQKQYWETKTPAETSVIQTPAAEEAIPFSVALKEYGRDQHAFVIWQNYKQSVLSILRVGMHAWLEKDQEISVEKLNYKLAERELYLFAPNQQVRDALEEVKFFLHAIGRRKKELEEIIAYLDKVSADDIWLSAERKQVIQEYQNSKEVCQKQLEIDTEEILRNLEEIFTAL